MTPMNLLDITRDALLVVLWVALPVVLVSTVSAVLVAIVQAVTQIQDQSIGQSIRLIVVMLAIVVTAGWLGRDVMRFAERAFQTIATYS